MWTPPTTTSNDVTDRFVTRSREATRLLSEWRADPRRAAVVPAVMAHTTAFAYQLSPADIESTASDTEHALGQVRSSDANKIAAIRDWNPPFAFTHLFHIALEDLGGSYTYQAFREWSRTNPAAKEHLWDEANQLIVRLAGEGAHDRQALRGAMRWRVGNAYYSFLRELYVLSVLRDSGVPVEAHPLADALFRADYWYGDTIISLYIGNKAFRDGSAGRKAPPAQRLADAQPPFSFRSLRLETRHEFGNAHLPRRAEIQSLIQSL